MQDRITLIGETRNDDGTWAETVLAEDMSIGDAHNLAMEHVLLAEHDAIGAYNQCGVRITRYTSLKG